MVTIHTSDKTKMKDIVCGLDVSSFRQNINLDVDILYSSLCPLPISWVLFYEVRMLHCSVKWQELGGNVGKSSHFILPLSNYSTNDLCFANGIDLCFVCGNK